MLFVQCEAFTTFLEIKCCQIALGDTGMLSLFVLVTYCKSNHIVLYSNQNVQIC